MDSSEAVADLSLVRRAMEKGVIQPGCEVVALYDFDQQNKEDLPFAAGEILTILKPTTDPHWVIAKRNRDDVQGVIPVPYVSLIQPQPPVGPLNPRFVVAPDASRADRQVPHPKESKQQEERLIAAKWYHGAISREDSERLILEARCDGAFLVRDSSTHSGDYTLVVLKLGSPIIDHYRIQAIPEVKLPPEHKKAAQSRVSPPSVSVFGSNSSSLPLGFLPLSTSFYIAVFSSNPSTTMQHSLFKVLRNLLRICC